MVVVFQLNQSGSILALTIIHISFKKRYKEIFLQILIQVFFFFNWFCNYLHNATVQKIKMPLTPRESENPTIQIEEHSDSCFGDRLSVKVLKKNLD